MRDNAVDFFSNGPGVRDSWAIGTAVAVGDTLWFGSRERFAPQPVRLDGTQLVDLPKLGGTVTLAAQLTHGGEAVLFLSTQYANDHRPRNTANLRTIDRHGKAIASWQTDAIPIWLVVPDRGNHAWVGLADNVVQRIELDRMQATTTVTTKTPWIGAIPWGRALLACDGHQLLVVDADTLAPMGTLVLPTDVTQIDVFGAPPDQRHLAIAHRSDVRILHVE